MLIGLGGYNPIEIRKKMRKLHAQAQQKKRLVRKADPEKKKSSRPEGEAGLLWDAYKLIHDLRESFSLLEKSFERLHELCQKALNLNLADAERASIQRLYVGAIRNLDHTVKNQKRGERGLFIFTGDYEKEGLIQKINAKGDRQIRVPIPSFRPQDLRLHLTKVDSMVNARKTSKKLKEIEEKVIQPFLGSLKQKEMFLDTIRKQKGLSRPNFDEAAAAEEDEEVEEALEENTESQSPEYLQLKKRIDRAAKAKGREHALLVNLTV